MKPLLLILFLCKLVFAEIDLQNAEIPNINMDDFSAIKEKCDKAGGEGTYEKLKTSKESLQSCVTSFANVTAVKDEIEAAKKTGSMDEVFGKYCAKRPKLTSCVENFTGNLRPCLNDEENKALNVTLDILRQLGDFVCYRDGDRIAMFIAEGGVECIQSKTEGIKSCVNRTLKIQPGEVSTNSLPNLLMDKKKCDDLAKLQSCVVQELEKCKDSTPANIVDALFKFIKKSACVNKHKRSLTNQLHKIFRRSVLPIPTDFNSTITRFKALVKTKCNENGGDYTAFEKSSNEALDCLTNKTSAISYQNRNANTIKEMIRTCTNDLKMKLESCLPEEEKYWPSTYITVMENVTDYFYKLKNELFTTNVKVELMQCTQNFKSQSSQKAIRRCLAIETIDFNSFKKEETCRKLKDEQTCATEEIKKRCTQEFRISKYIKEFFELLQTPFCAN